ncbi:MAG TPA: LysR family transcriptional regulator [Ruania sp.]|nr:LysR family transcriptional regulator [Ruania sp.]
MSNESWDLLDLRRLRHLVTVADVGSFTAAADELGLSQPGLSSSIRRLEEEVGTALLQRAARRAYPTPAGAHLVQAARGILAAATDARAQVRAVAGLQAGELTLGSVQTFTSVDLADLLARFHTEYPGVRITLREDTSTGLLRAVAGGEVDLAFVALDEEPLPAGVQAVRRYQEDLVLITGPGSALAERGQVALKDLDGEAFVDFQAGLGLQTVIERVCADAGLRRRIAFGAGQMTMVLALVRHGLGIAIVPRRLAEGSGLPTVGIGDVSRQLALVLRSPEPANPAAAALLRLLETGSGAAAAGLPGGGKGSPSGHHEGAS